MGSDHATIPCVGIHVTCTHVRMLRTFGTPKVTNQAEDMVVKSRNFEEADTFPDRFRYFHSCSIVFKFLADQHVTCFFKTLRIF